MRFFPIATLAGLSLAVGACSSEQYASNEAAATMDIEEAAIDAEMAAEALQMSAADDAAESTEVPSADIPAAIPKIAYVYEYGFRLSGEKIAPMQQRHADMCEALGPTQCRIIQMNSYGSEGDYISGRLEIAVAADKARSFAGDLSETVAGSGGEQVRANISGEDLSKQIVDTEARLRARTVLRDRLMEVLQTRRGSVAELVEAERGVAQVNQEIDQARSWLQEMQGRVNFSRVNLTYESGAPSGGGFMEPIRNAVGSLGAILGTVIAAIIVISAVLVPILLLIFGALALRRRYWPRKEREVEEPVREEAIETPDGA